MRIWRIERKERRSKIEQKGEERKWVEGAERRTEVCQGRGEKDGTS